MIRLRPRSCFALLLVLAVGCSGAPDELDAGHTGPDDAGTLLPDAGTEPPDAGLEDLPDAGFDDTPDAGEETPDAGLPIPEEFVDALTVGGCYFEVCIFGTAPSTVETCAERLDQRRLRSGFASGRLRFDEAAAQACIEALEAFDPAAACWGGDAADPWSVFALLEGCAEAATGTVPVGGTCYEANECESRRCAPVGACPGTCIAPKAVGEACADVNECAVGLGCILGKCEVVRTLGEACGDTEPCANGYACHEGRCVVGGTIGEGGDCSGTNTYACAPGLYCRTSGDERGTCGPRRPQGSPCTTSSLFGFESPECEGRQLCRGLRTGASPVPGTCQPPSDVGGDCDPTLGPTNAYSGCFRGLACDAATSKCVSLPVVGERCLGNHCGTGAYCSGTTCVALKEDGATCGSNNECRSNTCTSRRCVSNACVPK